jgi:HNH endonuclease
MELELGRELERTEHVMHSCDNPPCCNPNHLSIGTHHENMIDSMLKGRAKNDKTDLERDRLIYKAFMTGERPSDIAKRVGFNDVPSVYRVVRRMQRRDK